MNSKLSALLVVAFLAVPTRGAPGDMSGARVNWDGPQGEEGRGIPIRPVFTASRQALPPAAGLTPVDAQAFIEFVSKMTWGTQRDAVIAAIPAEYYERLTGRQVATLLGLLSDMGLYVSKGCYSCPESNVTYKSIPRAAWARMEFADLNHLADLIRELRRSQTYNAADEQTLLAFSQWLSARAATGSIPGAP